MKSMEWTFDSCLDVTSSTGRTRSMQVWSRQSAQWIDTLDWTLTEDTPGKENKPNSGAGHWTSTEAFKKAFPQFNR